MGQTPAGHRIFLKSCKVVATTWKMPLVSTGGIVWFFHLRQAVIDERATLEGEQKREKEGEGGKRHETTADSTRWKEYRSGGVGPEITLAWGQSGLLPGWQAEVCSWSITQAALLGLQAIVTKKASHAGLFTEQKFSHGHTLSANDGSWRGSIEVVMGGQSSCNTVELGTTFHHLCTWFSLFTPGQTAVHEFVICASCQCSKTPAPISILEWAHA